jgi:hypothetical protein
MYFTYLQDDFRVNSKLTLNLGVRYEFATPQWERDNLLSNFDPATQTLIFAIGGDLYDRALVHPDRNNWAPRLGLAYKITPKTVLRACYGISYVQFNRLGGENLLAYNGPNIVDAAIDQKPSQGICPSAATHAGACFRTTDQGFPDNFTSPSAFVTQNTQVRYIPANFHSGYVQSWHLTVQRELTKTLRLDVGNHDVGLTILADANQASPNLPGQNLSLAERRPFTNFNTIEESFNGLRQLQRLADQTRKQRLPRPLLHQLVHLVEGHRQRSRPSRKFRRRQFAHQHPESGIRERHLQLRPAVQRHLCR